MQQHNLPGKGSEAAAALAWLPTANPPGSGRAVTLSHCHTGPAVPSPGTAPAEEEEKEDTKPASLTQKMTLKPKMKYLMQQLTSGPL